MTNVLNIGNCDVAVIGAGPAGLAAATLLKKKGVNSVVVLDREAEAGGIPRHCGHPPFGLLEYKRIMSGPAYARALTQTALDAGVEIALRTSVTRMEPTGLLTLATPEGTGTLVARRVLLATGARETPRAARFVPGQRKLGITTTGALQSMVYLKGMVPFKRPVIVGSERVSFSALFTCLKAGVKPVAMVEEAEKSPIWRPFCHLGRLVKVPLYANSEILDIQGSGDQVESITFKDARGWEHTIPCDGVLFTGSFTPDSSLARISGLDIDPATGSPVTDKFGRCSDRTYFSAGNLMPPLNMSMNCWRQGRKVGRNILKDLNKGLPR
ncbi:MAG: NAD(P)/FAD-dependent oxidoreductase [Desulfobacterales bacterium]|nr:NAD(P)/FAD-dependent oxidoreductase [Desulfobacterales bacterium]